MVYGTNPPSVVPISYGIDTYDHLLRPDRCRAVFNYQMDSNLVLHTRQEALVPFGLFHSIQQELHCFDRVHLGKELPQDPDFVQDLVGKQKLFLTGR